MVSVKKKLFRISVGHVTGDTSIWFCLTIISEALDIGDTFFENFTAFTILSSVNVDRITVYAIEYIARFYFLHHFDARICFSQYFGTDIEVPVYFVFCVEKFGTERMQNLTEAELEKRVKEFINLVQFDISLIDA